MFHTDEDKDSALSLALNTARGHRRQSIHICKQLLVKPKSAKREGTKGEARSRKIFQTMLVLELTGQSLRQWESTERF